MKVCYCFLKKFNNYFNRKVIRYEVIEDYISNSDDYSIPMNTSGEMTLFDFNPNDNVATEIIANDLNFTPDYFLVIDQEQNILSRWYVIEMKRNRQGQWLYQLKRDSISDHINELINAPVFVQKAMLDDGDPFILNPEGMSFNQIKNSEKLLKDNSGVAWIVGYIARDATLDDASIQTDTEDIDSKTLSSIASEMGTTEINLASLLNTDGAQTNLTHFARAVKFAFVYRSFFKYLQYEMFNFKDNTFFTTSDMTSEPIVLFESISLGIPNPFLTSFRAGVIAQKSNLISELPNMMDMPSLLTEEQYDILKQYINTPISYLGKYYKLRFIEVGEKTYVGEEDALYTDHTCTAGIVNKILTDGTGTLSSNPRFNSFQAVCKEVYIMMDQISESTTIPAYEASISSARNKILNQEYDIFAIPAGPLKVYDIAGASGKQIPVIDVAQRIASDFFIKNPSKIYDVQLLPYAPFYVGPSGKVILDGKTLHKDFDVIYGPTSKEVSANLSYDLGEFTKRVDYDLGVYVFENINIHLDDLLGTIDQATITINVTNPVLTNQNISYTLDTDTNIISLTISGNNVRPLSEIDYINLTISFDEKGAVSFIFYPKSASFQGTIPVNLLMSEGAKIESNCNFYRLLSPNYAGAFEFNLAKNGGSCDYITYYCTYKPYTPFIKLTPNFSLLYGTDFNDNRGLICGGDFSLPQATSAWQTYQLNNKNYQNIFNRDVQNMDFTMDLETRVQAISGALGIVSDAGKGAMAGGYAGGGWGALAGAVVGGSLSATGFAVDVYNLNAQHREQRQYFIDKYNFTLGNVKALPQTLTKVGAFDVSSKIFPVLEYYTCTEQEKDALRSKIKYEAMTVMRIGLFGDYYRVGNELKYFKGELIRCDDIADDYHQLNDIYEELAKGVYM